MGKYVNRLAMAENRKELTDCWQETADGTESKIHATRWKMSVSESSYLFTVVIVTYLYMMATT